MAASASAALVKLKQQQTARRMSQGGRYGSSVDMSHTTPAGGIGIGLDIPAASASDGGGAYPSPGRTAELSPSSSCSSASAAASSASPRASQSQSQPLAVSPDIKPLPLYDARQLEAEMTKIAGTLRDTTSSGWSERLAALRRLCALVMGGCVHFDNFPSLLRGLRDPLAAQVCDLRSAIVREVCTALALLGRTLAASGGGAGGAEFESHLPVLLPSLFKNLTVSIQVIKESANECVRALMISAPQLGPRALSKVLEGSASASAVLRLRCVEYLLLLLELTNEALVDPRRSRDALLQALKLRLADRDGEVRQKARQAACAFHALSPGPAAEWLGSALDAKTAKMVREEMAKYEAMRGAISPSARAHARQASDQGMEGTPASAASWSSSSSSGRARRTHARQTSSWSSDEEKETLAQAQGDEFGDEDEGPDAHSQPLHHSRRDSSGRMAGGGSGGPVRASHAHSASLSMSAKRGGGSGNGNVLATPQQQAQHHRAKTMSATATLSGGGGVGNGWSSSGSTRRASGVFTFDTAGASTPAVATPAAAPGTGTGTGSGNGSGSGVGLASSQRLARSRSRLSGTPAGLAQSTRSSSSVRAAGAAAAASPALATPSAPAASSLSGSRARSASAVRASPSVNMEGTGALHLGSQPLSPSQALLQSRGSTGSSSGGGGGGPARRELHLLDDPLSQSQRSALLLSLLEQARDPLWSKRVHAFEQLCLIFNGGAGAGSTGPDAAGSHAMPGSGKKVPEVFVHLDKIVLCIKAGLGDVHHRVTAQALEACTALLTPAGLRGGPGGQLSEGELRPALERLLPDLFALLSHAKLPLRAQANSALNQLSQDFPPELLCSLLVHRALDAAALAPSSSSSSSSSGAQAHPNKVKLAVLEFLQYLLPLSRNYFRNMTTLSGGGGGGEGGSASGGGGPMVNPPMRALLSRIAPLLSASADAAPVSSGEPQLKKMCTALCRTLLLAFETPFLSALACLPVPVNRMVRRQLVESMPDFERKVAENQNQQHQHQHQRQPHATATSSSLDEQFDAQRSSSRNGDDHVDHEQHEQDQEEEDDDDEEYEPADTPPEATVRRGTTAAAVVVPARHLDFNQASVAAAAAASASASAAAIITPREQEHPIPAPVPAPYSGDGSGYERSDRSIEAQQRPPPSSASSARNHPVWSKRMTAPAAMVSEFQAQVQVHAPGAYQPRSYADRAYAATDAGGDDDGDGDGDGEPYGDEAGGVNGRDSDERHSVRSAMLPSHSRQRSAQVPVLQRPHANRHGQSGEFAPEIEIIQPEPVQRSHTRAASLHPSYLPALIDTISGPSAWPERSVALAQLGSYASAAHADWQDQFEPAVLALVDAACTVPPVAHCAETSDADAVDSAGVLDDADAAAAVSSALGVLEALLRTHPSQFLSAHGGGGDRLLELLLRSMLQIMRTTPTATASSSSAPSLISPRAAAAQSLQSRAGAVFASAAALCPPPMLLRLLLHVLATEQVHEGVLKLTLQRLAALVDARLDKYTLLDSAESFGLREGGQAASRSAPPPSAPLVECVVHALSLCTHSSVLVRKLVITAFVRLYARLRGDLLPFLDDLNPLLVKLVHIYIGKFDAQQQQQQQQQPPQQQQPQASYGGGRDVHVSARAPVSASVHSRSSSTSALHARRPSLGQASSHF